MPETTSFTATNARSEKINALTVRYGLTNRIDAAGTERILVSMTQRRRAHTPRA